MNKAMFAAGAGLAALLAMPAQAGHFFGTYTSFGGAPTSASIAFTTDDAVNGVGGHDILAISGNVDGDAITGLVTNPNQPYSAISSDGLWQFDNVLFDGNQLLDLWGALFTTASGVEYNLWGTAPGNYTLYGSIGGHYGAASNGNFQSGPVPETATWAMMLMGFGAMGVAMRRRTAVAFA
jgi:hypothetical protein